MPRLSHAREAQGLLTLQSAHQRTSLRSINRDSLTCEGKSGNTVPVTFGPLLAVRSEMDGQDRLLQYPFEEYSLPLGIYVSNCKLF